MLRSITFDIEADEPDLQSRRYGSTLVPTSAYNDFSCRVMFEIYDGDQWSHPATVTVTVEPVNDQVPQLTVSTRGNPFVEESNEGVVLLSTVTLSDRDHPERFNFTGVHVSNAVCIISAV